MLKALRTSFAWPAWPVAGAVILANLFVAALVDVSLRTSHEHYLERAAVTSRNTNQLVAESIASEIDRIDMGLAVARDEYAELRAAARWRDRREPMEFLQRLQERLPMTDSLRIADAGGAVRYSTGSLPAGTSIADRAYFIALRADAARGLVISEPVLSRISGQWVLIFARRINRPDGAFDGVVFAPVNIEWFNRKFAQLEVGPRGAVVLRGDASRDFDLLARFPQAGFVGQTTVSPQFRNTIAARPRGGTYEANAGADNIRRTFSYQPVGGYPLITLVGLSTEDTLAEWWREAAKYASLAATFAFLTLLGGRFVLRAWQARTRSYEEIRVLNAELARDNVARRQAEEEVGRLNAGLEQRVRERTAELEAANKELESFSYSVSHDLRAPLRAIDGFALILTEEYDSKLDEDGRHCLDRIRSNAVRMGTLIDDMLDFSRMSRREMAVAPVDMAALAREVFDEVRGAAPQRKIELRLGDLPPARGDRAMLRQVLVNLIANAVKFTAERAEAVIEVTGAAAGKEIVYNVKDNGVGFDMRYVDKLFGVFQRLHSAADFQGTGIGLAIVKRIVERHGGRAWAEGAIGTGAALHFTLPNAGAA
ncbi:MAG: ATP-binding protein [Rhodocyclaceae bacterium]|nr:ATP-binding protein [Rhodocyclaceae bacterium]